MDRPTWDRIQEIYHSTLPMASSERHGFLAAACAQSPLIFREVNSLLDAESAAGDFLESSVFEIGLRIISSNDRKKTVSRVDNLVGATINNRYLVEKELGHGGIGKVYLARDLDLHSRPVVIKVLLEASLQEPYVVKKFRQEVEALARIDHPNVVNVLGAGKLDDGKPYIVMQWVSGITLRSQIPIEGMNLARTASILRQVGAALDDVHEKGIFHRDLKPDNIMMQLKSGTEFVKIVDFGIAKVKDSVVAPSTVNEVPVGTLLYMSPEQLRGGSRLTAASDIYSMGIIAYEMITGRRPFNPETGPQLLEMHRDGVRVKPVDLRASLSTEAQAIVLRALSFEPASRYQSASEFGDSLARALMSGQDGWQAGSSRPQSFHPTAFVSPVEPVGTDSVPAVSGATNVRPKQIWKNPVFLISSLLILMVGGWVLANKIRGIVMEPELIASRSFTYWLTVQKMHDDKPDGEAFPSSGKDILASGDKFSLNVNSPDPGYLYLFNEGAPTGDGDSFTLLYPTSESSNGSSAVGANQSISTNQNTITGPPGTENLWIVWADAPVPDLEAATTRAIKSRNGILTAQEIIDIKEFVKTTQSEVKVRTTRDRVSHMITVRGVGRVLVRLAELEHR
ncbi:MAG TPA: protein kinase [Pyrinomonadaceae bacterium]